MMKRRELVSATGLPWLAGFDQPVSTRADRCTSDVTGAIGDGARHPLSSRFKSLAAARAAFPSAINLSDEIDWCALQSSIDQAMQRGGGAIHVPNTGRPYVLNRPLAIDPNRITLCGDGASLSFPELPGAEPAILFRTSAPPMYGHEAQTFQGFKLIGPGQALHHAGIMFQTEVEALSSRAMIRDCAVEGFAFGVLFGDRAYGIGFSHVSIFDCAYGVHAPYGLRDAGETISFSQSYIFNCGGCISNPGSFDLKFVACSLDYCPRLIIDNNGIIDLFGCRLEIAPPLVPPIHCAHGRVNMFGGFFLINGPRDGVYANELFALSSIDAVVHLFSVSGWNWRTRTGTLTNGPGQVRWHEGASIRTTPASIRHP